MTKKEIEHIVKTIFRQIKKTIHLIQKDFDKESIHKFRVEIKKLRAFLRLLSFEMKEPDDLKLPKSLKEIYSAAGKVRSIQLQLSRTNAFPKNKTTLVHYKKVLDKDLGKRIEELKMLFQEKSLSGIEKIFLSNVPERIEESVVIKFYQSKIKDIKAVILLGQFSDTELHSIRKLLKDLIYVSKILQQHRFQLSQFIQLNENHLNLVEKIADELGTFNDICSSLPFLKPAYLNEISPEEKKKLEAVRSELSLKKNALKTDLVRLITFSPAFEING